VAELERLTTLSPDNLEARYRLATAYLELERSDEAAALLTENLRRKPDHLPSLRALARHHQQQGRGREAQRLYKHLLELDPANLDYHLDIARAARKRGELGLAEQHLKRYLERSPDDLAVRLRLGEVYLEGPNPRQAASLFEEVLKRQPENPEAHELLARAYRRMGDPGQALQALEKVVTLQGSRDPGQGLSRLREALDAYEETVSEFAPPHRQRWASNLERLKEIARTSESVAASPPVDRPESYGSVEEEEVPIIRIGGREPVLAVSEAEDHIDLDAIEETLEAPETPELSGAPEPTELSGGPGMLGWPGTGGRFGPSVELRDETPMSLVSLLDGEALYEENPNWQDYQPPPFVPSAEQDAGETAGGDGIRAPSGAGPLPEDRPLSVGRLAQRVMRPPPPPWWSGPPPDAAGDTPEAPRFQVVPPEPPPERFRDTGPPAGASPAPQPVPHPPSESAPSRPPAPPTTPAPECAPASPGCRRGSRGIPEGVFRGAGANDPAPGQRAPRPAMAPGPLGPAARQHGS